jgi:hypothetical protein
MSALQKGRKNARQHLFNRPFSNTIVTSWFRKVKKYVPQKPTQPAAAAHQRHP